MKKTRIVTFYNAHNYGAVLQGYALKATLEKMGHLCGVMHYENDFMTRQYRPRPCNNRSSIKGRLAALLTYPVRISKYNIFRKFIESYLADIDKNECGDDVYYISGSDQVWNYSMTDFDKTYFLDFVKYGKYKNSYSASFGFDEIPAEYKGEYKSLLESFNKISVRETAGAKIISDLIGKTVPVTLDPTMLLTPSHWERIAPDKYRHKKYILMYLMVETDTIFSFANKLKAETGLDIIYINDNIFRRRKGIKYRLNVSPREWVSLFLNASYVITNSFHGTAFSINFNKSFFVELLPPQFNVNSRLENILGLFGLENRLIKNGSTKNPTEKIDYIKINKILENERKSSFEYLKSIFDN